MHLSWLNNISELIKFSIGATLLNARHCMKTKLSSVDDVEDDNDDDDDDDDVDMFGLFMTASGSGLG